jgi:hypothetical protein
MFRFWHSPYLFDPEPGAGGGGTGDPPPALKADDVRKMIDDSINGFAKRFKGEIDKTLGPLNETLAKLVKPPETPPPDPDPKTGLDPKVATELSELRKTVGALNTRLQSSEEREKAANERAEKTDRESAVRTLLNGYKWATPRAQESAFKTFFPEITRSEDGTLVANGVTAEAWIKEQMALSDNAFLARQGGRRRERREGREAQDARHVRHDANQAGNVGGRRGSAAPSGRWPQVTPNHIEKENPQHGCDHQ